MSSHSRKRKRGRHIVIGLSTTVLILFLAYAVLLFVSSWTLENALEELREAAGEPTYNVSDVDVNDTRNLNDTVTAYSSLFAELERIDAGMEAYKVDLSALSMYDILKPDALQTPEEQRIHEAADAAEEKRKEVIVTDHEALILTFRELTRREGPVVPPGALIQDNPRYPYYSSLREIVRLLMKHAELAASDGNYGEVAEDIMAGLRFTDALALDDSIVAQMSRMLKIGILVDGAEATLRGGDIASDQVFGFLLAQVAHSAVQKRLPVVIARDATHGREVFDRIRAGDKKLLRSYFASGDWGEKAGKASRGVDYHPERIEAKDFRRVVFVEGYTSPLARPLVDRDERIFVETMTKASALVCLPYKDAMAAFAELQDEIPQTVFPIANTCADVAAHAMTFQANRIARLDLLRVGLSAERFHAKSGAYPESLDDIAPILGTEIPMDPFTGESYHYVHDGDSFLLYSVGENLTDDGGQHGYNSAGDIVWRGQ